MPEYTQPYMEKYPHLFSKLVVNGKTFKNRIITAPTHHAFATDFPDDFLNYEGIQVYGERALGGAAAVTIGEGKIDDLNSVAHGGQVNCFHERSLQKLHYFTDYVHTCGALASIEFSHAGHFALPEFNPQNLGPMSSTACVMPNGLQVKEMTEDDMEQVIQSFVKSVCTAKRAGFDIALLHFGNGWLISGFLSPMFNKRTDEYGGSVENRTRFPLRLLKRVKEAVGDSMIIELRLSGDEHTPPLGLTAEDTIEILKILEPYCDMAHVVSGTRLNPLTRGLNAPCHYAPDGLNADLAEKIKKAGFNIPIGVAGAIYTPELAEQILAEGKADYILMAKNFVADPLYVEKVRSGREDDIRPCIACKRCSDVAVGRVSTSKEVLEDFSKGTRKSSCSVNPYWGHSISRRTWPAPEKQKKVCIVGGGVAGLQAAITAAERGHDVSLYEKTDRLGGQLYYTDYVWEKRHIVRFRKYLVHQIEKLGVKVYLNTEATPKMMYEANADAVIVAVGAKPFIPPIPGIDSQKVIPAIDAFAIPEELGKEIVVIGGGMSGCEISLFLAKQEKNVVLLEMGDILAPEGLFTARVMTVDFIENNENIKSFVNTKCMEITADGVVAKTSTGEELFFKADNIILASGMRPLKELKESFEGTAFDVIAVGDCDKVGTIYEATATGCSAALRI